MSVGDGNSIVSRELTERSSIGCEICVAISPRVRAPNDEAIEGRIVGDSIPATACGVLEGKCDSIKQE